jgi:hypothetical protein
MAQYCEICGQVTNCTEDCRECLAEEKEESKGGTGHQELSISSTFAGC